jgi:hypothetical protein
MWVHYCTIERCWISVGYKEPCNWCGKNEAEKCKPQS